MQGKPIRLICVGKLKQAFIKEGCDLYLKRLKPWVKIEVLEVKDVTYNLPLDQRKKEEANYIKAKLTPKDLILALDEGGLNFTSVELANFLTKCVNMPYANLTFIIGGPFGLDQEIIKKAKAIFSLSKLTFTHEMARLILCEQIYRAHCILKKIPYHH